MKEITSPSMRKPVKQTTERAALSLRSTPKYLHYVLSFAVFAAMASLAGCGTNEAVKPQIGPITFTDAYGNPVAAVTVLQPGSGVYLQAVVTHDPSLLGVNWVVTCSSQLPPGTPLPPGWTVDESCGFFTPPHTLSGPVPNTSPTGAGIVALFQAPNAQPTAGTVTIYATSTLDPSKSSSITLSILP